MARTWTREDAAGEKVTRERIEQSLNITGSILDATVEINDTTIRDEELAGELDTARTAVARARELVLPEPAQSYRFRIDWWTTILDEAPRSWHPDTGDEEEQTITRYPIRGYTIVNAEDLDDAKGIAEQLCDAEFFAPTQHYSASGAYLVGGAMWQERSDLREWDEPAQVTSDYLGTILPNVDEWNFDDVKILDVQPQGDPFPVPGQS